jgi:hypothetical protein
VAPALFHQFLLQVDINIAQVQSCQQLKEHSQLLQATLHNLTLMQEECGEFKRQAMQSALLDKLVHLDYLDP